MCGACGAGRSGPRWEDTLGMPTRAVLRARATEANRVLGVGARLRVRPWFSTGYLLADRVGRSTHVTELDSLWTTARGWGATLPGWEAGSGDAVVYPDLPVRGALDAVAVWLAAVAHLARPDRLEVTLPDPTGERTVVARVAPGAVTLTAVPGRPAAATVRGVGATEAARHLRRHLAEAASEASA
ncbi:MAG: hypothetical protein QOC93_1849 [Actinomycetota bacterium]|jgi:hypothetical protein|nr:hypothetical protein [Actinomycetota bacterium]